MRIVAAVAVHVLLMAPAVAAQSVGSDSVVYRLAPASRFEARTGKSGFFSFAGHEHLIRARGASGRIVLRPGALPRSSVTITVAVDSLEVLTPPDTAEIRQVTKAMREAILHAETYHEITFVSTTVAPIDGGFRVLGRLTLVGQTRDVSVDLVSTPGQDTLRLEGRFPIRQTDYGITPYRGGPAGIVRVADRVVIHLIVVAVRSFD